MQLLQELSKFLTEGAVADRYEELKDDVKKCAIYMCVEARQATADDFDSNLHAIVIPSTGPKRLARKGDYVARILITGSVENPRPMSHLFILDAKTFAEFTELPHAKPDVEGFIRYEVEGEECEVVKDGSRFIVKVDKDLTQMPASLFNKQYRIKG